MMTSRKASAYLKVYLVYSYLRLRQSIWFDKPYDNINGLRKRLSNFVNWSSNFEKLVFGKLSDHRPQDEEKILNSFSAKIQN